jgi:hypothetical protein
MPRPLWTDSCASHFADIAQPVERDVANVEVVGSNPTVRSIRG